MTRAVVGLWQWVVTQRAYWLLGRIVWRRLSASRGGEVCLRIVRPALSPAEVDQILAGVGVVEEPL